MTTDYSSVPLISKTVTFKYRVPQQKIKLAEELTGIQKEEPVGGLAEEPLASGLSTILQRVQSQTQLDAGINEKKITFTAKYQYQDKDTNLLSKTLESFSKYDDINQESERIWTESSFEVVESLKTWRRLYKLLDFKKRQIKRTQLKSNGGEAEEDRKQQNSNTSTGNESGTDNNTDKNQSEGGNENENENEETEVETTPATTVHSNGAEETATRGRGTRVFRRRKV